MNFKRAREIFGFLRSSCRFAVLSRVSLVALSNNVIRGMCGPQCWRKALPDLCHGILARLLAFVEVRPPRCNMQHGHERHGCNDGRRSTPEFFHGLIQSVVRASSTFPFQVEQATGGRGALLTPGPTVCRILEAKLVRDRFNVINHGVWPPFPGNGQQNKFRDKFDEILHSASVTL
jgi:hypothetical protein